MKKKRLFCLAAALVIVPSLSWGAGFALFEHGSRGMAMGGAMTGLGDDLSAMYWNTGGIAFQTENHMKTMAGVTLIAPTQDFEGESPYPGDGYRDSQIDHIFYPPHFYATYALNDRTVFGFSVLAPFGLGTHWDEDSAGRFISKRADVKVFALSPNIAFKFNDYIGFGIGADYNIGQIDLTRNIAAVNPYTQQVADIGQVHLHTDDMSQSAWGWHAGLLVKTDIGLSFGINYRSSFEIDYDGIGSFQQFPTGYADFDYAVTTLVPFGEKTPLTTSIEFPEFLSIGIGYTADKYKVSLQYNEMGWDSFQYLPINFTEYPELSSVVPMGYETTNSVRLGFEYILNEDIALQAGLLTDETPQPTETMSPLLGDGDRVGYSIGMTWNHDKFWTEIGYLYLDIEGRSTDEHNHYQYFGTYKDTVAHLLAMSLGINF